MPCYYAHLLIQPPPPPPKVTRNPSPFAGGNHTTQHERMASSTTRNAANGMPPSYEEGSQRGYEVGQVWRNIILQRCIEPMYIPLPRKPCILGTTVITYLHNGFFGIGMYIIYYTFKGCSGDI